MRKNNNKRHVRPITTGYIEADMLGQVYLWISERTNRLNAQRFHRKTYKRRRQPMRISELYIRGLFRAAIEWSQTAPTACLRSIKDRISKMRKQKRNGN